MTRDIWAGVVVLGGAALYWLGADGIRTSPLDGPVGAAGLPKALAYALGLLAILLIARDLAAKSVDAGEPGSRRRHLRALGMLGLGVGYLLIVPYGGYALSIAGLLLAVALYAGARPDPKTLAFAGIGGAVFYLLFVQLLNIPLPAGMWPDPLPLFKG